MYILQINLPIYVCMYLSIYLSYLYAIALKCKQRSEFEWGPSFKITMPNTANENIIRTT